MQFKKKMEHGHTYGVCTWKKAALTARVNVRMCMRTADCAYIVSRPYSCPEDFVEEVGHLRMWLNSVF